MEWQVWRTKFACDVGVRCVHPKRFEISFRPTIVSFYHYSSTSHLGCKQVHSRLSCYLHQSVQLQSMQGQRSSKRPDQRLLQNQAFRHICAHLLIWQWMQGLTYALGMCKMQRVCHEPCHSHSRSMPLSIGMLMLTHGTSWQRLSS